MQNTWKLSKRAPHKSTADKRLLSLATRTSSIILVVILTQIMPLFWHSVKAVNEVREVLFVELTSEERNALQIQLAATNSAIKQRKSGILFVIDFMNCINISTFRFFYIIDRNSKTLIHLALNTLYNVMNFAQYLSSHFLQNSVSSSEKVVTSTLKRLSISIATNLQSDNSTRISLGFFRNFLRSGSETAERYFITFVFYTCGIAGTVRDSRLPVVLKGECYISNHYILKYSNTRHSISRVRIVPCLYLFLRLKRFCWFATMQNKNIMKFSHRHCLSSTRSYTRTQNTCRAFSTTKNTWHEGRLNPVTLDDTAQPAGYGLWRHESEMAPLCRDFSKYVFLIYY